MAPDECVRGYVFIGEKRIPGFTLELTPARLMGSIIFLKREFAFKGSFWGLSGISEADRGGGDSR